MTNDKQTQANEMEQLMESALKHSGACDVHIKGLTLGLVAAARDYMKITGCGVEQGLVFVVELGEDIMRHVVSGVALEVDPDLESRIEEYANSVGETEGRTLH